jgi:hypothetical protein
MMVLIDYRKQMFEVIRPETPADLVELNVRQLAKTARAFGMPHVRSTMGVTYGLRPHSPVNPCPSSTSTTRSHTRPPKPGADAFGHENTMWLHSSDTRE